MIIIFPIFVLILFPTNGIKSLGTQGKYTNIQHISQYEVLKKFIVHDYSYSTRII